MSFDTSSCIAYLAYAIATPDCTLYILHADL